MAGDERHVALLRGINVGGKNKLPMATLVSLFEAAGARDVRTYIQSGNVVFAAGAKVLRQLAPSVTAAIGDELGLDVPVVVRSAEELRGVAQANPFLDSSTEIEQLHVAFLADTPSRQQVSSLDPQRSPPDTFEVRGRDIFLKCPNGMARTKLTNAYFDSRLGTVSTVRNWKTVLALIELAG